MTPARDPDYIAVCRLVDASCILLIILQWDSVDNLAETLPQPELVNSSVSNTGKAPQSSDQRRGDETLQLQGQINLLKELVELKDGQIQEWAVRSKVEETKWREEGSRLVGENAALRNTASALNNDIIRLEHEVEGLKRANDGELILSYCYYMSRWRTFPNHATLLF